MEVELGRGGGEDEINRARTQVSTSNTGNAPPALIYETDRRTVPYVSVPFFGCSYRFGETGTVERLEGGGRKSFMQGKHPIRSKTVKSRGVNNFLSVGLTRQPITSCCWSLRVASNVSENLARAMSHIGPLFAPGTNTGPDT